MTRKLCSPPKMAQVPHTRQDLDCHISQRHTYTSTPASLAAVPRVVHSSAAYKERPKAFRGGGTHRCRQYYVWYGVQSKSFSQRAMHHFCRNNEFFFSFFFLALCVASVSATSPWASTRHPPGGGEVDVNEETGWIGATTHGLHGPEASIQAPRDTTGRCSNVGPSVASRAAAEPNAAKLILK